MTFLPIADRELRVAARKRSTFWIRVAAALVALLIGTAFLILTMVGPFRYGAVNLGRGLFGALTWLSLAVALSAGLFFTSDCLSEEKREGTIGFLFLTDLSGFDVVLGKLAATSLRSFYALLAVFPILAVTLLMGGVNGAMFWKTSLALVNALVISLAAGLFVSALSRDSQKALAGTLLVLLVLAAGGPAGDGLLATINGVGFEPRFSLSSPGYLFVTASAWGKTPFWRGLLVNQAVAWTLLGMTCALLPRTWQEKAAKPSPVGGRWAYWFKFGGSKRRAALRRKLVGVNPVLWLGCRERWQAASLWTVALLLTGGFVAVFGSDEQSVFWFVWGWLAGAVSLLLYLGVASQAGRFFVEAKRSGLLELLLATPLTGSQIVQGQWRALLRMFGPPLALCLAVQLFGGFLVQHRTWSRFAAVRTPRVVVATATNAATATTNAPAATNSAVIVTTTTSSGPGTTAVAVGPSFTAPNAFMTAAMSLCGTAAVIANLAALTWFGMWMGMSSRSANQAALKALVFVQIIPWFVISFASALIIPLLVFSRLIGTGMSGSSRMMFWYPLLMTGLSTTLMLGKDIGFSLWARRKFRVEFRDRATQAVAPIRPTPPHPPQLPKASAPPVIAPS